MDMVCLARLVGIDGARGTCGSVSSKHAKAQVLHFENLRVLCGIFGVNPEFTGSQDSNNA
jgi:hypothetical protein